MSVPLVVDRVSYMSVSLVVGLNIFYLYTLYREQHIKTYSNIQYMLLT